MELMQSSSFGMFVWIGKLFIAHFSSHFVVLLLSVSFFKLMCLMFVIFTVSYKT